MAGLWGNLLSRRDFFSSRPRDESRIFGLGKSQMPKTLKGHCPNCGKDRNAEIVGEYETTSSDEESGVWAKVENRLLRCMGCEEVFYRKDETCSEDMDVE